MVSRERGQLRRLVFGAALGGGAMASGAVANAEPRGPRDAAGLTFGGGLSLGRVECKVRMCFETRTAGIVNGHVGVMVRPGLAVLAEGWGTAVEIGDRTQTSGAVGLGARLWAARRVWISASVGVATTRLSPNLEMVEFDEVRGIAPAASMALGIELVSTYAFALEVHVQSGASVRDERLGATPLALGLGASWY